MRYHLVNKPAATSDIEDTVDYYKIISTDLANRFIDRLEEAKKHITENPEAFQIKYKNVRTILLKQFPYHIHYIVDNSKKQIIVLAIIHAYRNPKDYTSR